MEKIFFSFFFYFSLMNSYRVECTGTGAGVAICLSHHSITPGF